MPKIVIQLFNSGDFKDMNVEWSSNADSSGAQRWNVYWIDRKNNTIEIIRRRLYRVYSSMTSRCRTQLWILRRYIREIKYYSIKIIHCMTGVLHVILDRVCFTVGITRVVVKKLSTTRYTHQSAIITCITEKQFVRRKRVNRCVYFSTTRKFYFKKKHFFFTFFRIVWVKFSKLMTLKCYKTTL